MVACAWIVMLALGATGGEGPSKPDQALRFETDVRPILKAYCFECHGEGDALKGKLDVRLARTLLRGGESGPAIVAGKPEESLLFESIEGSEMPPGKKKLSKAQVTLIGRWISAGARTVRPEPERLSAGFSVSPEEQAFWSFQPVVRPKVPVTKSRRATGPIDAFLLASLESRGLGFASEADRHTLLRRATFDLTGLPPAAGEAGQFLADRAEGAYERLIDRLLASPRYGERWARVWLDVAGYADSDGFTGDRPRVYAYRYRDYLIRSFNADKPFDRMIHEQLAGDELVRLPYRNLSTGDRETLAATGFLRTAADGTGVEGADRGLAANQVVADTVQVVSTALLGLTIGCAQCHNHRFDPIPQTDYYRFRALFEPALDWKQWRIETSRQVSLFTDAERESAQRIDAEVAVLWAKVKAKKAELIEATFEVEVGKIPEALREPARAARRASKTLRTAEQKKLLADYPRLDVNEGTFQQLSREASQKFRAVLDEYQAKKDAKPKEEFLRALTEVPGRVPATFLFHRGEFSLPRQEVAPGELTVLDPSGRASIPRKDPGLPTSGRRLAYAHWLTSDEHPLTARVVVNRVWKHHFGRGIVATPGDFGAFGERPTHPELLNWLADDFRTSGWQLKRLHKQILMSAAYRQSSVRTASLERVDPENRLLGRMNVRRLEAEEVRDAMLAVAGALSGTMFGPPVPVRENEVGQVVIGVENKGADGKPGPVVALKGEEFRRSVYVQVRRSLPLGMLETFDAPAMEPNCTARGASTVAPQSLMLMNNDFVLEQAGRFAERLRADGASPREQTGQAWQRAFARPPTAAELDDAAGFLTAQTGRFRARAAKPARGNGKGPAAAVDPEFQALVSFCQALFSANPFLYVD